MFTFFFGKSREVDAGWYLGSKKLPLLIENIVSTFVENQWLYRNEIYSEALVKILEPILCNGMVCLNIFGEVSWYMFTWYVYLSVWISVHFEFYLFSNW
jgi:hypothetical protein